MIRHLRTFSRDHTREMRSYEIPYCLGVGPFEHLVLHTHVRCFKGNSPMFQPRTPITRVQTTHSFHACHARTRKGPMRSYEMATIIAISVLFDCKSVLFSSRGVCKSHMGFASCCTSCWVFVGCIWVCRGVGPVVSS